LSVVDLAVRGALANTGVTPRAILGFKDEGILIAGLSDDMVRR
jgi:hypothetical protein